jgi:hypothetical protein
VIIAEQEANLLFDGHLTDVGYYRRFCTEWDMLVLWTLRHLRAYLRLTPLLNSGRRRRKTQYTLILRSESTLTVPTACGGEYIYMGIVKYTYNNEANRRMQCRSVQAREFEAN